MNEANYASLEAELVEAREALRKIIFEGDYTAPEGMKMIAKAALKAGEVEG